MPTPPQVYWLMCGDVSISEYSSATGTDPLLAAVADRRRFSPEHRRMIDVVRIR